MQEAIKTSMTSDPQLRQRIHLNNLAVTRTGEPIELFKRYDLVDPGSSMLQRVKDSGEPVKVGSVVLEEHIRSKALQRIDLIKVDVEGANSTCFRPWPVCWIGSVRSLHLPYIGRTRGKSADTFGHCAQGEALHRSGSRPP